MSKRYVLAQLLLIASISFGSVLNSMEDWPQSHLRELPAELQEKIIQSLGNKVAETVENIKRLSLTDTYFKNFIQENRPRITKFIQDKFGSVAIFNDFTRTIIFGNLNVLKLFDEFNLIAGAKKNRAIILGLVELLRGQDLDLDRLKKLFADHIIEIDKPRIRTSGGLKIPVDYLYNYFNRNQQNLEKINKFKELFEFLINSKLWDINKLDYTGSTALAHALYSENAPMVEFLLDHGADLNLEITKKALQYTIGELEAKAKENFEGDRSAHELFQVLQKSSLIK